MRRLNEMFHIDGERLVKTSNGQPVPDDEPLFVLRARDHAAVPTLLAYIEECRRLGTPADRIDALVDVEREFFRYSVRGAMKVPGSTHGR
jgi:hypothetical protein